MSRSLIKSGLHAVPHPQVRLNRTHLARVTSGRLLSDWFSKPGIPKFDPTLPSLMRLTVRYAHDAATCISLWSSNLGAPCHVGMFQAPLPETRSARRGLQGYPPSYF